MHCFSSFKRVSQWNRDGVFWYMLLLNKSPRSNVKCRFSKLRSSKTEKKHLLKHSWKGGRTWGTNWGQKIWELKSVICHGFLLAVSTYPKPGIIGTKWVNRQHWCSWGLPSSSSSPKAQQREPPTTRKGRFLFRKDWGLDCFHLCPCFSAKESGT